VLVALLTLVLLAAVIAVISAPLLRVRAEQKADSTGLEELRTAREAKYRELRDLELDYRTGKLSQGDYEATDRALRAEALGLLNRLEELEAHQEDDAQKDEAQKEPATPKAS
jgi:hypothetical protein